MKQTACLCFSIFIVLLGCPGLCDAVDLQLLEGGLPGYEYFIYTRYSASQNWYDAEKFCLENGGHLMTVENETETQLMTDNIEGASSFFWIGLNKIKANHWNWKSGTAFDATVGNWADDYPNLTGSLVDKELCAVVSPGHKGKWITMVCTQKANFFCKRKAGSTSLEPPPYSSTPGACPDGFKGLGNKCFIIHQSAETWEKAAETCAGETKGKWPSIASFSNVMENAIGAAFHKDNKKAWMGKYRMFGHGMEQPWVDNSDTSFDNWLLGGKDNKGNKCGYIQKNTNGKWIMGNCLEHADVVCQTYKDGTTYPIRPLLEPSSKCPIGYGYFWTDVCLKFVSDPYDWNSARMACRAEGADLVSIHAHHENAIALLLAAEGKVDMQAGKVWTGLKRHESFLWKWSDDSPVVYTSGISGSTNEAVDNCAALKMSDNEWSSEECSNRHAFICGKSLKETPPLHPHVNGTCPKSVHSDFEFIDNPNEPFCYGFRKNKGTSSFESAQERCKSAHTNAGLISISNPLENAFVYEHAKTAETYFNNMWLGLKRDEEDGTFKWLDGTPMAYEPWVVGDHDKDDHDCAVMFVPNGDNGDARHWKSVECTATAEVHCKVPKIPPITYPDDSPGFCPMGWERFGTSCILNRAASESVPWGHARQACKGLGAELVAVDNPALNDFLKEESHSQSPESPVRFWLGLHRYGDEGPFTWVGSGMEAEYSTFNPISSAEDGSNCVSMQSGTILWYYEQCSNNNGYVCQMPKAPVTEPPKNTTELPDENNQQDNDSGLPGGSIAGIVIGVLVAVVAIGGVVAAYFYKVGPFGHLYGTDSDSVMASPYGTLEEDNHIDAPSESASTENVYENTQSAAPEYENVNENNQY